MSNSYFFSVNKILKTSEDVVAITLRFYSKYCFEKDCEKFSIIFKSKQMLKYCLHFKDIFSTCFVSHLCLRFNPKYNPLYISLRGNSVYILFKSSKRPRHFEPNFYTPNQRFTRKIFILICLKFESFAHAQVTITCYYILFKNFWYHLEKYVENTP